MNIFLAVCTIALCTSSPSADACPSGTVAMASFKYKGEAVVACEDLSTGNGTITVIANPKSERSSLEKEIIFPVMLQKRVLPNQGVGGDGLNYLNYTKEEVLAAPTDVLGNMLLGIHGFAPRVSLSFRPTPSFSTPSFSYISLPSFSSSLPKRVQLYVHQRVLYIHQRVLRHTPKTIGTHPLGS